MGRDRNRAAGERRQGVRPTEKCEPDVGSSRALEGLGCNGLSPLLVFELFSLGFTNSPWSPPYMHRCTKVTP